jgi:hypothetical protein
VGQVPPPARALPSPPARRPAHAHGGERIGEADKPGPPPSQLPVGSFSSFNFFNNPESVNDCVAECDQDNSKCDEAAPAAHAPPLPVGQFPMFDMFNNIRQTGEADIPPSPPPPLPVGAFSVFNLFNNNPESVATESDQDSSECESDQDSIHTRSEPEPLSVRADLVTELASEASSSSATVESVDEREGDQSNSEASVVLVRRPITYTSGAHAVARARYATQTRIPCP